MRTMDSIAGYSYIVFNMYIKMCIDVYHAVYNDVYCYISYWITITIFYFHTVHVIIICWIPRPPGCLGLAPSTRRPAAHVWHHVLSWGFLFVGVDLPRKWVWIKPRTSPRLPTSREEVRVHTRRLLQKDRWGASWNRQGRKPHLHHRQRGGDPNVHQEELSLDESVPVLESSTSGTFCSDLSISWPLKWVNVNIL